MTDVGIFLGVVALLVSLGPYYEFRARRKWLQFACGLAGLLLLTIAAAGNQKSSVADRLREMKIGRDLERDVLAKIRSRKGG